MNGGNMSKFIIFLLAIFCYLYISLLAIFCYLYIFLLAIFCYLYIFLLAIFCYLYIFLLAIFFYLYIFLLAIYTFSYLLSFAICTFSYLLSFAIYTFSYLISPVLSRDVSWPLLLTRHELGLDMKIYLTLLWIVVVLCLRSNFPPLTWSSSWLFHRSCTTAEKKSANFVDQTKAKLVKGMISASPWYTKISEISLHFVFKLSM